jgi:arylformamidase
MNKTPRLDDPAWLDAQYDNRARVANALDIISRWQQAAALSREKSACVLDVPYGPEPSETLDVFPTSAPDAPVMVFVHGGYWRALDKSDFSFVAPSFVQEGAMVVVPNYALCPAVTIDTIALQMTQALAWTWRNARQYGGDPDRIVVVGHSAGGHLAAMLLACDWQAVGADLPAPLVRGAVSISGVFDLEPLARTPFLKGDLQLTAESARKLSPALFPPPEGPLHALVGADESEEFLRQNALIRERWGEAAVPVCETIPGANHFQVMRDLADTQGVSHRSVAMLLGLP